MAAKGSPKNTNQFLQKQPLAAVLQNMFSETS